MIICTEMGAMNRETGDLIHYIYMASKVSPLVAGRWDVTGSNTCRYKVESQIEGMIKRRLAGVLMRGFANHFFSRLHLVKVEWKDKMCTAMIHWMEQKKREWMYTICTIEGIMEMEMFPLTELVRESGRSSCRGG